MVLRRHLSMRLCPPGAPCSLLSAAWWNYEFANGKDLMEVWVFPAEAIERGQKVSKKPVEIKDVGDDAFMDRGMHGSNYVNLFVKKGGTTVRAGDEEKLKALAQKALNRF